MFIIAGQMLINTVCAMFTAYLTYIFLKDTFKIQIIQNHFILFTSLYGILNGVISTLWSSVLQIPADLKFLQPLVIIIFNILIIKYILRVEWVKSVLSFLIISIFSGIGSFTVPPFFYLFGINATMDVVRNNLLFYLISNIIIFTITFILVKLSPIAKMVKNIKNLTPVLFLLLIAIVLMASLTTINYVVHFEPISFILVLVSVLIYFFASLWYIRIYHKYETQQEEQHQQKFYNESLANTIQDLKRIKHDQANHLSVLYAMHQMKKYDAAESYLKEILNTNETMGNTAIYDIKNAGLFGIISTKVNFAKTNGIQFDLKVFDVLDSIPNIRITDLCEVIGIYLDNAIEEVLTNKNLKIEMQVASNEDNITIRIDNGCTRIPDLKNSIKGKDRGNGLMIANKILSSYKNILNSASFNKESMVFSQILTIKKEMKEIKKEA